MEMPHWPVKSTCACRSLVRVVLLDLSSLFVASSRYCLKCLLFCFWYLKGSQTANSISENQTHDIFMGCENAAITDGCFFRGGSCSRIRRLRSLHMAPQICWREAESNFMKAPTITCWFLRSLGRLIVSTGPERATTETSRTCTPICYFFW